MNEYQRLKAKTLVSEFFINSSGEPYQLTDGQADIFTAVFDPSVKRAGIKAVTQYGKSEVTALALDLMATSRREKILIVSPSEKQSQIIMNYVILHLFDDEDIKNSIIFEGRLEKLKQERSKKRITFINDSEIFILTANAREVSQEARNLMGFGATTVIVDESALIPDSMFNKILRMVGTGGKLVQLGNPFPSPHFERVFKNERYLKISIDYHQALKEGRLTQDFIDEVKEEMGGDSMDFKIFYECVFPEEGIDNAVLPASWVDLAVNQQGVSQAEENEAGLDVARFGKDKTVYCLRSGGVVKKLVVTEKKDTMEVVGWTRGHLNNDSPSVLRIDSVGLGAGVYDRLEELLDDGEIDCELQPVNVGEKPEGDEEIRKRFKNLKAQIWWSLREWFKPRGGKSNISIPNDPELIKQLKEMRYSYDSSRRLKIESKEEVKKRLGQSPDKADALALAFYPLESEDVGFSIY